MARPAFLRMLKHRCRIRRPTPTGEADEYNQPITAPVTVESDLPCLLQQRRTLQTTGRSATLTEEIIRFQDILFCDYGTNIREGDLVDSIVYKGTTTNLREDMQGEAVTFTVVEVIDAAGQRHHLEVKLKAVAS